jgi:phosphatidylinositol glycan class B
MRFKELAYLSIYRIIICFLTRNYEHPDEHWQGPEVAHKLHYGYGFLTWEWTFSEPLRNPLYPFLLSLSYYAVDLLGFPNLI